MKCEEFSELDLKIMNEARYQQVKWPADNKQDQINFLNFVKSFTLDVIHDSEIQKQLLTPTEEY